MKMRKRLFLLPLLILALTACEEANLEPLPSPDFGSDKVLNFHIEKSLKVALYQDEALKNGNVELKYGSMDANFITLGNHEYMVEWSDEGDFFNIRINDKLNFRWSKYLARVEKTGRVYKVIRLNEL